MRIGMIMAALACLILGILPTMTIGWMDALSEQLVGDKITITAGEFGWLWLTPIAHERASYSAPIVLIVVLAVVLLAYILLHIRKAAVHRAPPLGLRL